MDNAQIIQIAGDAKTWLEKARKISVVDAPSLSAANDFLHVVKAMLRKVAEAFDPIIKQAHEAHRQAIEKKKEHEEPFLLAEKMVKAEIGRYLGEQASLRREAEEKARREAAEAERQRKEKMQAAIDAENAGNAQEADAQFEEAMAIEPPKPIIPEPVKAQGTYLRKEFKWRLVNLDAVPREYLALDRAKVETAFRIQREKMAIPGIETYEEMTVVSRTF